MAGHVVNPSTKFEDPSAIRSWVTSSDISHRIPLTWEGRSLGCKISGGRGRPCVIFFGFYKTRHILLSTIGRVFQQERCPSCHPTKTVNAHQQMNIVTKLQNTYKNGLEKLGWKNSKKQSCEQWKTAYNWDLFVFGPEFAILSTPRPVCVRFGLNSSLKASPQTDLPPWPVPSGSPPCIWIHKSLHHSTSCCSHKCNK